MGVHRVHYGDFVVDNDIGIVCHAVFNNILSLEEINVVIVYAYVFDVVCDLHNGISFSFDFITKKLYHKMYDKEKNFAEQQCFWAGKRWTG